MTKLLSFRSSLAIILLLILAACSETFKEVPSLSAEALQWHIQTVDSLGVVGSYTSLKLDSSGNPVISYYDETNGNLKLLHCGNVICMSGNSVVTIDSAGDVGKDTSLALDSSGNPVISYYDETNDDLKLVHCGNPNCSIGSVVRTVDSLGDVGRYTSLVLDSIGNPVMSYIDDTIGSLKLVHCGDAYCSSGNDFQLLDNPNDGRAYTSLVLDNSGNPVISYFDAAAKKLKLAHCSAATCAGPTNISFVDTAGDVGAYTSLDLDKNDNPVISYYDFDNGDLKLVHCGDANCTFINSIQSVDTAGVVGLNPSLVLDSSGNPVISYHDGTNTDLKLVHCGDTDCASGNTFQPVDTFGTVGQYTSLVLDSRGNPVISYYDATNGDLKLARLRDSDTTPPTCAVTLNPNLVKSTNHKLTTVNANVSVSDSDSGPAGFTLLSVISSENDSGYGSGDAPNDIQGWSIGTPDTSGQLRNERYLGAVRTYTISYQAKDNAGNAATCTATVQVKSSR